MDLSWVFYLALVTCAIFAFGIGANDVANSFGTSIGSGALSIRTAVAIAAVCELSGAVTLGAGVSDTIIRQISRLDGSACWDCGGAHSKMPVFMLGMACALVSGAAFLMLATWWAMPVSTTHVIVGAVLGMTLVGTGASCVRWGYPGLLTIVASWFWSPLAAGAASSLCLLAIKRFVLQATHAEQRALIVLPLLFGATVGLVVALVLLKAQATSGWPAWQLALAPAAAAACVGAGVQCFMVPWVRARIQHPMDAAGGVAAARNRLDTEGTDVMSVELAAQEEKGSDADQPWVPAALEALPPEGTALEEEEEQHAGLLQHARRTATEQSNDDFWEHDVGGDGVSIAPSKQQRHAVPVTAHGSYRAVATDAVDEGVWQAQPVESDSSAERVFLYLQVLSACLKSYAHGANDTANAAGPFAAVQALYLRGLTDCDSVSTPLWVLAFCGFGIVVGLALCGYKVMNTVGKDLVDINFSRGFAIELGSTLSVVLASVVGMPVSSTHCQIGSIVAVGITEAGLSSVRWQVFRNIVLTWVVTVPIAALVSGLLLLALRPTVT